MPIRADHFLAALEGLKERLARMGQMAEQSVDLAVECYQSRNAQLCSEAISLEGEISQCERNIDEIVIQLQARNQPRSTDLRMLTACTKISTHLRHIGELSLRAADVSLSGSEYRAMLPVNITGIGAVASGMVRRAMDAFERSNPEMADAIFDMAEIMRRRISESWVHLAAEMRNSPEVADQAINALLVVRNLERTADYSAHIADDTLFWVCGADTRQRDPRRFAPVG